MIPSTLPEPRDQRPSSSRRGWSWSEINLALDGVLLVAFVALCIMKLFGLSNTTLLPASNIALTAPRGLVTLAIWNDMPILCP
jgi:hypothetical protein